MSTDGPVLGGGGTHEDHTDTKIMIELEPLIDSGIMAVNSNYLKNQAGNYGDLEFALGSTDFYSTTPSDNKIIWVNENSNKVFLRSPANVVNTGTDTLEMKSVNNPKSVERDTYFSDPIPHIQITYFKDFGVETDKT